MSRVRLLFVIYKIVKMFVNSVIKFAGFDVMSTTNESVDSFANT